ncbi:MAG: hypothetical protein P9L92_17145 [Candidatus Electryonea clarkiae]|nr:hypothetical protein [Candidatus Electryonea clarkiae]MDP8286130.1 hypothetical protein [Candidatus Electryonea clarkiae]
MRAILFLFVSTILFFQPATAIAGENYDFDMEEFEPKKFKWGGYSEIMLERIDLNTGSAIYKLNFHDDPLNDLNRFNGALQLEFSYRKGIGAFNSVLRAKAGMDDIGWSDTEDVYEANLSLKPSPYVTIDLGKKVFRWGKGYAWNPVGFIDRPKDPNNPEESLEGYSGASIDLIKSFNGALQTVALTTVVLPVREGINEDFGEINHLNLATKLYLLYQDTDIDFVIFNGESRSTRYGVDFSRNLVSNFEIHGEFARLTDLKQNYLSETGTLYNRELSAIRYLLGMRYLTESDITTIIEYYHNGAGFSESELERFYQLIDDADAQLLNTGTDALFQTAKNISKMGYSSPQSGRNYLYMKISQKDPFDILYFTPGLIAILNLNDQSSSISPEMLYTGFTNWEIRLRFTSLIGGNFTEFAEKQNKNKLELRVRYHF